MLPPQDKALQEINAVFLRMRKSYCAMKKLEYLLEAVRLTYEGVRDSNNPKKAMNDLGADGNRIISDDRTHRFIFF